jgi:hypothetical protein
MPNPHSDIHHSPMCACFCDTWALAGNRSEPVEGSAGTSWIIVWLYLNSDSQLSRSESSTHDTSTYGTLKISKLN